MNEDEQATLQAVSKQTPEIGAMTSENQIRLPLLGPTTTPCRRQEGLKAMKS